MKYCTNCGNQLDDSVKKCPFCQAEQEVEDTPESVPVSDNTENNAPVETAPIENNSPKKKKRFPVAAVIAIAVVLALAAACAALWFTGAYVNLLPASRQKLCIVGKTAVQRGLDAFFTTKQTVERDPIKADVDIKASIELNDDHDLFSSAAIIKTILERVSVKLSLDQENKRGHLGLNMSNSSLLDVFCALDDDVISVISPQLAGMQYDIKYKDIMALNEYYEESAESIEYINYLNSENLDEEKTRKEVLELYDIIIKLVNDKNTVIEKNSNLSVGGGATSIKCDVYTITPTKDEKKAVLKEVIDYLSGDSYLGGLIEDAAKDYSESYSELHDETDKDIWQIIRKNVLDEADYEYKEVSIKIALNGTKFVSARLEGEDKDLGFDVYASDDKAQNLFAFFGGDEEEVKLLFTVKEDKTMSGRMSAEFDSQYEDDFIIDYSFDLNKRSALGTFAGSMNISFGEAKIYLTAEEKDGGMMHVIKINMPDEEAMGYDLEVSTVTIEAFVTEGGAVDMPKDLPVTEVTSEEQLYDILAGFEEELYNIELRLYLGGASF